MLMKEHVSAGLDDTVELCGSGGGETPGWETDTGCAGDAPCWLRFVHSENNTNYCHMYPIRFDSYSQHLTCSSQEQVKVVALLNKEVKLNKAMTAV